MKRVVIAVVTIFMMALLPRANAHAGENVTLAAFGQPSSPQVIAAAVAEPGSPVVGKTVAVTNDLHFTIGYRLWLNYWQTDLGKVTDTVQDINQGGVVRITDSTTASINQFAAASIPSLGIRYKDFFASASVMISPDYHFPKEKSFLSGDLDLGGGVTTPHSFIVTNKVTGSRNEVDVNVGYYVHPWIALTMGYKGVFQKFKDNFSALDTDDLITTTSGTAKSKPHYNGGTIGIAANVPIPEAGWIPAGFSIYGNGGGGVMGSNDFRVAFYGTIDTGLAYKPTQLPLLFTAGFKLQIINSLTKSDAPQNHIIDYTRGMILGLHYIF